MDPVSHTVINLIIFVLAIYVGYHVVWTVTPALHTPLMAVTNAISAIVIVGAMLAAALTETGLGKTMGVLAVALAAVNVFGAQIQMGCAHHARDAQNRAKPEIERARPELILRVDEGRHEKKTVVACHEARKDLKIRK